MTLRAGDVAPDEDRTYRLEQLSPDAREAARDWYREHHAVEQDTLEWIVEGFAEVAEALGFCLEEQTVAHRGWNGPGITSSRPAVAYSIRCSQGDFACFRGSWSYRRQCVHRVRRLRPNDTTLHDIAQALASLQRRWFYQLAAHVGPDSGHGRDSSRASSVTAIHRPDDNEIEPGGDVEEELNDIIADLDQWLYTKLRDAFLHEYTDEAADEWLQASDSRFTVDGEPL